VYLAGNYQIIVGFLFVHGWTYAAVPWMARSGDFTSITRRQGGALLAMLLARQPILDKKNQLYGYELLYRNEGEDTYHCQSGDMATSSVMAAGFLSMRATEISDRKKIFINFTESMLLHKVATLFPREQLVVEVLENVEASPAVIAACQSLKAEGYTIALDDFVLRPGMEKLIETAEIIKVDFRITQTKEERRNILRQLKNHNITFLAEKIESPEDFQMAVELGYTLFQGYYFARPIISSPQGIPPAKANHLKLIKLMETEDPKFEEITRIVEKDVAFSYEILRIANSTHYYRGSRIVSVRQAAIRIGLEELRKWAFITVLRKIEGKNRDTDIIVTFSVQRAKALEFLCQKVGLPMRKMEFFTLGILSMIDVLLGCPIELVLPELPISEEAKQVLAGKADSGQMSACYQLILAYEKGEWAQVFDNAAKYAVPTEAVAASYLEAIGWTNGAELN
jgi:c-di-GMP-related signal transduction protein